MLKRIEVGMSAKYFRLVNGIEKRKTIWSYLNKEQIDMVETLQKVEVVLDIQFSAVNCKNLLLHRLILFAL